MPVLIVSENTCPHDGFSRKRSTRPSSSRDHDSELERVLDRLQADRDRRALLLVELDDLAEVDVAESVA